ncbi:MAG TPA: hypothetical protein VLH35_04120 [Candidatus Acidoferrales bacterium]|nr:hypothetical protein [Candidatus Acidoferrales bacterium]
MADESKSKKSKKLLIAAVLLIVIVAAVSVGVYYYLPNQTAPKPDAVTNFSDGAWANYNLTIYNATGTIASNGTMMVYTYAGTYNGTNCWVYVENVTYTSSSGATIVDVVTDYIDKTTYATLHSTQQTTSDGTVMYDKALSPGDAGFMDVIATVRNMTVTATDKSVTVLAGTFSTTERQGTLTYPSDPNTVYDLTSWASTQVPTWGIVKYQFHVGGVLSSEYLLVSYGS